MVVDEVLELELDEDIELVVLVVLLEVELVDGVEEVVVQVNDVSTYPKLGIVLFKLVQQL